MALLAFAKLSSLSQRVLLAGFISLFVINLTRLSVFQNEQSGVVEWLLNYKLVRTTK